jgi:hypothetical protein
MQLRPPVASATALLVERVGVLLLLLLLLLLLRGAVLQRG